MTIEATIETREGKLLVRGERHGAALTFVPNGSDDHRLLRPLTTKMLRDDIRELRDTLNKILGEEES
jgi:hypothetical protein